MPRFTLRTEPADLARREWQLAAAVCLAASCLFFSPFLLHLTQWGIQDWDQHAFYHEAARVSLLEYGQLPQWNPYYCGGTDLLANPQSRVLSPTFAIVLAFGSVIGLKIEMVLFAALGMLGLYALGRQQGLDRISAWLGPCVYFLGPLYALPNSTGMTWIMSVAYLPWVLYSFFAAFSCARWIIVCGACLSLMYTGGGAYPLVITLTALGCLALLAWPAHGARKVAAVLGGALALCVLLGAVKLLPSIAFMHEFPRHMVQPSGFSAESLWSGLFDHGQRLATAKSFDGSHFEKPDRLLRGLSTDYDDVGMYIGPVVAALFVLGLIADWRRRWVFAVLLVPFVWLSLGERPSWSLFELLHRLPVYESMRYSERFRFIWFLSLCLFAGAGLQRVRTWCERRWPERRYGLYLSAALVLGVAFDLFVVTRPIYEFAYTIPPLHMPRSPEFRQIGWLRNYDAHGLLQDVSRNLDSSWSAHLPVLLMNLGAVNCYETAFVPRQPTAMTSPDYRGEVYLLSDHGQVSTLDWTPNHLVYAVHVREPSWLIVNQNYYPAWKALDGRPLRSHKGLIALQVQPSDTRIELRYERASFYWGAAISLSAWLAVLLLQLVRSRQRQPRALSAAAP